jgi:hypothetical protein
MWVSAIRAIIGRADPVTSGRELDLVVDRPCRGSPMSRANFAGGTPSLAGDKLVDVLVEVWLRTIYGTAEPD